MPAKIINPRIWLYRQQYYGKEVNGAKYNKIFTQYMDYIGTSYAENFARACGCVAVSSSLLSRREQQKFRSRRVNLQKNKVYYMFPASSIPMDIFCKLETKTGKYVYESTEKVDRSDATV
ncbi:hypothetical protein ABNF65_12945 [Paenibacillus larvae]